VVSVLPFPFVQIDPPVHLSVGLVPADPAVAVHRWVPAAVVHSQDHHRNLIQARNRRAAAAAADQRTVPQRVPE
jgi:hypothetical protein